MIDLDELEKLAKVATPGPWEYDWTDQEGDYARQFVVTTSDIGAGYELFDTINRGYRVSEIEDDRCEGPNGPQGTIWDEAARNDAAFIAAANPQNILALIERVRKAEDLRPLLIDRINELRAELNDSKARNAELVEALKPFASRYKQLDFIDPVTGRVQDADNVPVKWVYLRNAARAIGEDG